MSKNIAILFIRCLLFATVTFFCILCLSTNLKALSRWWSIMASAINILTIGLLLLFCKKQKISYKQLIGYKKGTTKISYTLWVVAVMLFVGILGMYLSGFISYGVFPYMAVDMVQPIPLGLAVANVFVLPITTTFAEDGLYLGFGVNRLKNKWIAICLPALVYALQHCFIPFLCEPRYLLYRFLSFLPLTLLLCFWYYKKRDPLPFMIGHFVLNLATVIQIVIFSANSEWYEQIL